MTTTSRGRVTRRASRATTDASPPVEGVFPSQRLREAVADGLIVSDKYVIPDTSYQPASLDLRLGDTAYRLQCSFLPDRETVEDKLRHFAMGEVDIRDGAILERNRPYLIPLSEGLRLPPDVRGRTSPRSSTGRLDIFTRVITDQNYQFDEIPSGYEGRLYLEVFSRSFTIRVRTGMSLNQLRLMTGVTVSPDAEIAETHRQTPLLFRGADPVSDAELSVTGGLLMSLDLASPGPAGFKAKKNSQLLDLAKESYYEPDDFWEPARTDRAGRLVLEPEDFYLLVSKEGVSVPPQFSAEMVAYDPTNGELRTHYAGFFDPGFGYDPAGKLKGARAVLEVRAHDVPFAVEDGQPIAKLVLERMQEKPAALYGLGIGSHFQGQVLWLSKQFKPLSKRRGALT